MTRWPQRRLPAATGEPPGWLLRYRVCEWVGPDDAAVEHRWPGGGVMPLRVVGWRRWSQARRRWLADSDLGLDARLELMRRERDANRRERGPDAG